MDFLNKAFAQFNDLFRSMSPGARITAGLLLVVAVASVGYLFQSQVGGGDEYLFGGVAIPAPTLQKMEEAFGTKGLNGFTFEGGRVKVPRAQRATYLAALAESHALPPNFGDSMNSATETGMWIDPKTRERKYLQSLMDEMSLVISSMKDIERASVLIDSQPQPGLGQPPIKTASVFASAAGGVSLTDEQVEKICYYVAAAIAGMSPENVTVTDAYGGSHVGTPRSAGAADDTYSRAVRKAEQDLNTKIRAALTSIPNVTVTSTVVLDRETSSRESVVKNDPKTVPVRVQENSRSTTHESNSPGGPPGLQPQGGGVNVPVPSIAMSGKNGGENSEESRTEQVNVVSTTSTEKVSDGRAIKSAKVAIGIPASYYEKVWRERNPTKTGEEAKKPDQTAVDAIRAEITKDITSHVATLLPPSPDVKDPLTLVTATTFQDLKPTEIPGPAVPQRVLTWLTDNWSMLAMAGLVLVSVAMLRSALRSVPAAAAAAGHVSGGSTPIAARMPASEAASEEKEEAVEVTAARRLRRITGSGPSLRDELSEMVKDDPDSAASILRTWIGQAN